MKSMMKYALSTLTYAGVAVLAVAGFSHALTASDIAAQTPIIGQVRTVALSPTNRPVIADLHREGWLEARGQLLQIETFPELFRVVGRTWTADGVPASRFAIPDIRDSRRTVSSDNPYGVLGPGDLVTSNRRSNNWLRASSLTYWIFAGRDVSGAVPEGDE